MVSVWLVMQWLVLELRNMVRFLKLFVLLSWCSGICELVCFIVFGLFYSVLVKLVCISFGQMVLVWMFLGLYFSVRLCIRLISVSLEVLYRFRVLDGLKVLMLVVNIIELLFFLIMFGVIRCVSYRLVCMFICMVFLQVLLGILEIGLQCILMLVLLIRMFIGLVSWWVFFISVFSFCLWLVLVVIVCMCFVFIVLLILVVVLLSVFWVCVEIIMVVLWVVRVCVMVLFMFLEVLVISVILLVRLNSLVFIMVLGFGLVVLVYFVVGDYVVVYFVWVIGQVQGVLLYVYFGQW